MAPLCNDIYISIDVSCVTALSVTAMSASEPKEGHTLTATFKVTPADLASAASLDVSDSYAHVLATQRLVAFMEIVCARMLVPCLGTGQLSVGVKVEMDHLAATPVGEEIKVTGIYVGTEGKQYVFDCSITDTGGEVGRGRHRRAMIDEKRLMDGARKRMAGRSKI